MTRVSLWLFDIDGTLVDTGGAGMASLREAAEAHFGRPAPALDLAGSTDAGVVAGLYEHFRATPRDGDFERFCARYLERLEHNLAHGRFDPVVFPGVLDLLESLAGRDDVAVGLLTGNIEDGARAKMRRVGLDHHFAFGAYGCDHADRNRLGPIALERASLHAGRAFSPAETLVVGDTPKDVACAAALGARCLGVATGGFTAEGLAGADHVVESLADPEVRARYFGG